jgi:hypothetical protein
MNRWKVGEDRGSKETDGCPLTSSILLPFIICDSHQLYKSSALHFTLIIPSDSSAFSSIYPSAFVGCWWDLRRDSSSSYLHIILVLGVFQALCGVGIINTERQ